MANLPVPTFDPATGRLPDVVMDALQTLIPEKDDDQVAAHIAGDTTASRVAVAGVISASPAGPRKQVRGGNFPKPARFATLTVADAWPNARGPFTRILWSENKGQTLYAFGQDQSLRKSTNGGASWSLLAYLNWGPAPHNLFIKLPTGTLLTANSAKNIYRSTDDGKTWTIVGAFQSGQEVLGTQSWAYDPTRQFLYLAMYGGIGQTQMNLMRSSDDGATWTVVHSFPGAASSSADKITHLHAVQWDPYMERVIISAGDTTPATGLYRTTADGNSVEPLVLNRMLPTEQLDAPRTIGVMPFPDYLAWASDSTTNPWLFRMARTEIGKANPVVERVYQLNSTAWFSCRAADDGSRWVITASQESTQAIDRLVHLYAVEDQGATIYEVGTIAPTVDNVPASSLMPVGQAESHGETLLMSTRQTGANATWKFRLGMGAGTNIPWPARPYGETTVQKTIGTGPSITLGGSAEMVIGYEVMPGQAPVLYIFDGQVQTLTGVIGNAEIGIRRRDTKEILYSNTSKGDRYTRHLENGSSIAQITLAGTVEVEIFVRNVLPSSAITVNGSVTYGVGPQPSL